MSSLTQRKPRRRSEVRQHSSARRSAYPRHSEPATGRRIASNFAFLSLAELVCRATSVIVTLSLAKRLGVVGYGRIEFAFNVVFWLVLLVRDSSDVIVARELSRHPRLIKPLVDHVLALKGLFALILFSGLALVGTLTLRDSADWWVLTLYGLMLFTTAIGLDFVYRGTERMGLLAVSLCLRTFIYAVGVLAWVGDARRIVWVPIWLAVGEASGIALVWLHYLEELSAAPAPAEPPVPDHPHAAGSNGLRDPAFAGGDQHGRPDGRVALELVVGRGPLRSPAPDGHGPADLRADLPAGRVPHAVAALAADGAGGTGGARLAGRGPGDGARAGRGREDGPGRAPGSAAARRITPGAGLLAGPGHLARAALDPGVSLPDDADRAQPRDVGVRSLVLAALGIGPLVALLRICFGLPGAAAAVLLLGLGLVVAGYGKPGPGRTAAGLAPSPGPAAGGIAGDGSGLPGPAALACAPRGRGRGADLWLWCC